MIKLYENDNIYVRPFTKDDMKEPYLSWFYDPEVTRFNSHGLFPYTDQQKKEFIVSLNTNIVWAIISKKNIANTDELNLMLEAAESGISVSNIVEEDIHIGNIALQSINWVNRSAEFAVVIGNTDYWGKGICTQATTWLFDHGFGKLNLNRIWSGTVAVNTGMQQVFRKLGMKEEGRFRKGVYLDGDYYDVVCYGILKEEWPK